MNNLQKELSAIGLFLKRNRHEAVVISSAALFLTLNKYHPIGPEWSNSLLYYAVLPIIVIVVLLRKNVLDFGFRLGNPRKWGIYVAATCLVSIPILYAVSRIPLFQSYYRVETFNFINYFLASCVSLLASEFLFRGFLLFGLKERLKEMSILVQMIPFVLVHFGKPELETLSTILTGVYFGYIVYRGNSYWPAFLIHLFINVFFVACVNLV
jgi:membrane protease YdiL (CAAX protease family)